MGMPSDASGHCLTGLDSPQNDVDGRGGRSQVFGPGVQGQRPEELLSLPDSPRRVRSRLDGAP